MTTSDEQTFNARLGRLEKLKAAQKRHEAAIDAIRKEAAIEAPEAARAGFAEGVKRVRAKVLEASPFSATTLRQILDAAGIPPDDRFARTPKSQGESE